MFILFFTITYFSIVNSYIKLQLKSTIPDLEDLSPINFYKTYFSNEIYTTLNMGTPLKKIDFQIMLNIYSTALISLEFKEQSSSFYSNEKNYSFFYNTGFRMGIRASDKMKINDINLDQFNFFYSNDSNSNIGILGLNYIDKSNKDYDKGLIYQLKKRDIIKSYYFYIEYKNDKENNLIIGKPTHEVNSKYKEKDFIEISKKGNTNYFEINIDNLFYGKEFIANYQQILFNYNENFIKGTYKLQNVLLENFFEEYIKINKCFSINFNDEMISYYCNDDILIENFQNIKLFHKDGNFTFELNYKDLFKKVNGKYYFLMYFQKHNPFSFIVGKPFLKKYLFVFNQDKRTIGYYKIIPSNNNLFIVWLLIIICFFIIILLGSYILIYRPGKLRKKRLNEIDDEYEYNVQKI